MAKVNPSDQGSWGSFPGAPWSNDYDPIVIVEEMKFAGCSEPCKFPHLCCREPCCFPCCCCCCCYPACGVMPCCKSQKANIEKIYEPLWDLYVKSGVFQKNGPLLSFTHEYTDTGYKITEVFRNIEGAEYYYANFNRHKWNMFRVLGNLPFRQFTTSEILYGNRDSIRKGKQMMKFIPAKLEGNECKGRPFVQWDKPPTREELEKQFGKFHFGFVNRPGKDNPSRGEVDPISLEDKPMQMSMDGPREAAKAETA